MECTKNKYLTHARTFFVIDSWVKYEAEDGARIWSSGDVPIVSFGGHHMGDANCRMLLKKKMNFMVCFTITYG